MRYVWVGVALALCLPPLPLGWLLPLPLLVLLGARGGRQGFWAGLGFWAVHLIWLPQSFVIAFDSWLGAVPIVPLVLIKAASWAALFALTRGRPLQRVGGWVILEYLTTLGELAFPWGLVGYGLVEAPGRYLASLGGVFLLSLVVLLVAFGLSQRRYWVGLVWLALWVWPLPPSTPQATALLVQGDIDPYQKAVGQVLPEQTYLDLTREGLEEYPQVNLVVWPETAVRVFDPQVDAILQGRPLISGLEPTPLLPGYPNRVVWRWQGVEKAYRDKAHLAPFGEFFPFQGQLSGLYGFFFSSFGLGNLASRQPGPGGQSLGPYAAYICYESVFPTLVRRLGSQGRVLVLSTNDAWFGPSFGADQHFQMGRLRAVENGRWLLRAGNDGVTASVDPFGRVVSRLPRGGPGVLEAPYSLTNSQTLYQRLGDWPLALALLLLVIGWQGESRRLFAWKPRPNKPR